MRHYAPRRRLFVPAAPTVKAVNGVTLRVSQAETLGLVGESGCGKSTLARLALGLEPITRGQVLLAGQSIRETSRQSRTATVQFVMQDPYSSLNPRMTVSDIVAEAYIAHPPPQQAGHRRELVTRTLETVGLSAEHLDKFPHQLSGGQRQRVGIARALAPRPKLLICDEPVSALDVSVQAQIINLLNTLKRTLGLAYLFISHDLAVVRHISDRIAVMYLGLIVEEGPAGTVYDTPAHPYTRALLAATSTPAARRDTTTQRPTHRIRLTGERPDPANPPPGCAFHTRCWKAQDICATQRPELRPHGPGGRAVRCHFPE
ncbi:MAG: ABC transporter ATP-binding protein [Candidatus Rokuibacteriota bacterium]